MKWLHLHKKPEIESLTSLRAKYLPWHCSHKYIFTTSFFWYPVSHFQHAMSKPTWAVTSRRIRDVRARGGGFSWVRVIAFIRSSQMVLFPELASGMATCCCVLTNLCQCFTFPQEVSFLGKSSFLRFNPLNILVFSLFTLFWIKESFKKEIQKKVPGFHLILYPKCMSDLRIIFLLEDTFDERVCTPQWKRHIANTTPAESRAFWSVNVRLMWGPSKFAD